MRGKAKQAIISPSSPLVDNIIGLYTPNGCPEVAQRNIFRYKESGRITTRMNTKGHVILSCNGAECPVYKACNFYKER